MSDLIELERLQRENEELRTSTRAAYDYDLSPTPLQLECERLRKEAEIGKQMLSRMMSEYAELRDQLAEAKKDAEQKNTHIKELLRFLYDEGLVPDYLQDIKLQVERALK